MALHPSIRIEGGLLGPDLLDELRVGELPGQRPGDFVASPEVVAKTTGRRDRTREVQPVYGGAPRSKRSLTDEVARAFADARSLWAIFQHRRERLRAGDLGTSMTRASWVEPFLGLLDYELTYNRRAYDLGGLTFAISHRAGAPDDAPPVHIVGVGQELGRTPAAGRSRLAPHALLQEYLNRTEALWGLVTNGSTLRLLRDSTYVRRQAYVEFDLPGMLDEQRFEDFEALYRLLHRSRLPRSADDADDCLIERYFAHGIEQGGRIRERLRDGVEQCLQLLANGFLRHPANHDLRRRVASDTEIVVRLTEQDLYRHLLVLVYRFLFLLVAEDRGLIGTSALYRGHYGVGRLRALLDRPAGEVDHDDLWQSLRVVWRVLGADQTEHAPGGQPLAALLGLAVLNGDLFKPGMFDEATIDNRDLIAAFDHLARYEEGTGPRRRVNYAALDVEELGSVYESLLDRRPVIESDAHGRTAFRLVAGSERKSTGSFYTPPDLVAELVKSALKPVLEARLKHCKARADKERALLSLRVCDPACGSGHFLLAATRRLGKELAIVRTGEQEPAPERVREAVRDVVAHSIYGVDRNPLAVDLCRVALWIESHAPEKPLTFLDHRIRCGDSLLGVFDLDVLADGIPDAAFAPLAGDDREAARVLKRQNRDERRSGQYRLPWDAAASVSAFAGVAHEIDVIADDSPDAIRRKRELFERRHDDPVRQRQYQACHLWNAAFFQPLRPGQSPITTATLVDHLAGRSVDPGALTTAAAVAVEHRFFHWPLEFPEVFEGRAVPAGFDVVLGNPPWERVKLQEKEFFAGRHAAIAHAPNAAARKRMITTLASEDPALYQEFCLAQRAAEGQSRFLRDSGRYPLCGRGDINLYTVFAELIRLLASERGRAGCVLPTGIATDDTTKFFFQDVVKTRSLVSLFDFENKGIFFPHVHSSYKFCLFTVGPGARPADHNAQFVFFAHDVRELGDPDRVFTLSADEIDLLNPNTRTCPIFRSQKDAELTKAIYRRVPVLAPELPGGRPIRARGASSSRRCSTWRTTPTGSGRETSSRRTAGDWIDGTRTGPTPTLGGPIQPDDGYVERFAPVSHAEGARSGRLAAGSTSRPVDPSQSWAVRFNRMMDMSNDSHLFRTRDQLEEDGWQATGNVFRKTDADGRVGEHLPLYEAKMVHHFDHRWATYENGRTRELTVAEKQDPERVVLPRYWVDAREVYLRTADLPKGLLDALRKGRPDGILFGVAHLLFAHRMHEAFGDAVDEALHAVFTSWVAFAGRHRFAKAVSPIGMVMRGDGPACFQPLDESYVPAMPLDELAPEELDIDDVSSIPWWTREDLRGSGSTWYAASHKGVSALLQFATDNAHVAEFPRTAPPLHDADDAMAWAEELLMQRAPRWLMGWRDICRSTDERTLISGVIPRGAVGDKFLLIDVREGSFPSRGKLAAVLLGSLGSFACDFTARQKVGGTSLKYFTMKQVAVLRKGAYTEASLAFVVPRVLELAYTNWEVQPFAQECAWDGPPFRWDEARRFLLRAELDAAFFRLYLPSTSDGGWKSAREVDGARTDETRGQLAMLQGHFPTPRDAVDYIMETFRIVKRKDEKKYGEYRTKRVILEIYDAMQDAASRGLPYRSGIEPPPADPRCCHPPRDGIGSAVT